jgi:hypothetical protein
MKIIRNLNAFCHELKSTPDIADPQAAVNDIVRIVDLPEVAESVQGEFAQSIGAADLLKRAIARG